MFFKFLSKLKYFDVYHMFGGQIFDLTTVFVFFEDNKVNYKQKSPVCKMI